MLDRAESLARRERQVPGGYIVLPVDERARAGSGRLGQGTGEPAAGCGWHGGGGRSAGRAHARARGSRGLARGASPGGGAIRERGVEREHTAAGPGAAYPLRWRAGKERLQPLIPPELAA